VGDLASPRERPGPAPVRLPAYDGAMKIRFDLVILAVRDVAAAKRFYVEVLGWRPRVDAPVYCELASDDGFRLGLYARDRFAHNVGATPAATPPGGLAPTELYLYASAPGELLSRAERAGARPLSPIQPREWGENVGYVADPDGNVIAVAESPAAGT
jgi:uncharacterized protein